jgi:hypothetical protein
VSPKKVITNIPILQNAFGRKNNAIVSVYYRKLFRIVTTYRKYCKLNNAVVGGKHFGAESFRIAILCMKTSNYYQCGANNFVF